MPSYMLAELPEHPRNLDLVLAITCSFHPLTHSVMIARERYPLNQVIGERKPSYVGVKSPERRRNLY